jgi:peroxiredoxin
VHEAYPEDVIVLGLAYATGDRDSVRGFVEELGVDFPVVICDEDTRAAYEVACLPTNFVLDREGRIRHVSRRLMNAWYWEDVITTLIAED